MSIDGAALAAGSIRLASGISFLVDPLRANRFWGDPDEPVPMPDLPELARSQVSAHVQQLLASGNKIAAIKAYRDETNVDLPTASRIIDSL